MKCKKDLKSIYGEGSVSRWSCQKGHSFMLEISLWMMLHDQVGQLKLTVIKLRYSLRIINIISGGR